MSPPPPSSTCRCTHLLRHLTGAHILIVLLHVVPLLGEDADEELALLVGLEGARNDAVGARRQLEATRHLAQVDEARSTRH